MKEEISDWEIRHHVEIRGLVKFTSRLRRRKLHFDEAKRELLVLKEADQIKKAIERWKYRPQGSPRDW